MNTSIHDSLNLAWKMNLVLRNVASPDLLSTYEDERRKIAKDLINFDYEHANAFHDGDAEALAKNFNTNVKFISGVGAEYTSNILNLPSDSKSGAQAGCLPRPARLTRYIDANPVDAQTDIPMLGQFRIYFACSSVQRANPFLHAVCSHMSSASSILGQSSKAMKASYEKRPLTKSSIDIGDTDDRYRAASSLYTLGLITTQPKSEFEISDLPPLLQASKWTIYLDDVAEQDTRRQACVEKWIGTLQDSQVAVLILRPDGYVGTVRSFSQDDSSIATGFVDKYFGGFLLAASS